MLFDLIEPNNEKLGRVDDERCDDVGVLFCYAESRHRYYYGIMHIVRGNLGVELIE